MRTQTETKPAAPVPPAAPIAGREVQGPLGASCIPVIMQELRPAPKRRRPKRGR